MDGPDGVEVCWLEQCAADVPGDDQWLSAAERATAAAMRISKRRDDWRLGRWTAKCAIVGYAQLEAVALPQIEIQPAPSGAPVAFVANTRAPLVISLSHRDGRAICAVAPPHLQLGCDLEVIEPRSSAFAADYFTVAERALVSTLRSEDRDAALTLMWSLKECALKALQVGLREDSRAIEVTFSHTPIFHHCIADNFIGNVNLAWSSALCRATSGPAYTCLWQRDRRMLRAFAVSHEFRLVSLKSRQKSKPTRALPDNFE
jgi:4'-phosphopantetheinyl transferase